MPLPANNGGRIIRARLNLDKENTLLTSKIPKGMGWVFGNSAKDHDLNGQTCKASPIASYSKPGQSPNQKSVVYFQARTASIRHPEYSL